MFCTASELGWPGPPSYRSCHSRRKVRRHLLVLCHRVVRRRDDALRGVLLLIRRGRKTLDNQGSGHGAAQCNNRLATRRPSVDRYRGLRDDRPAAQSDRRDLAVADGDARRRCRGKAVGGLRYCRDRCRDVWRGIGDHVVRRLCPGPVPRLAVGQVPPSRRSRAVSCGDDRDGTCDACRTAAPAASGARSLPPGRTWPGSDPTWSGSVPVTPAFRRCCEMWIDRHV